MAFRKMLGPQVTKSGLDPTVMLNMTPDLTDLDHLQMRTSPPYRALTKIKDLQTPLLFNVQVSM